MEWLINKLFVASITRNKMPPKRKLDSLRFFFFHSLTTPLLLIMLSHQAFHLVVSRTVEIFDRVRRRRHLRLGSLRSHDGDAEENVD